jgi:hypothetical protein
VFRSTSFPNKRILIFLSFFLQRDMKTIFSSLCDFFFFFPRNRKWKKNVITSELV